MSGGPEKRGETERVFSKELGLEFDGPAYLLDNRFVVLAMKWRKRSARRQRGGIGVYKDAGYHIAHTNERRAPDKFKPRNIYNRSLLKPTHAGRSFQAYESDILFFISTGEGMVLLRAESERAFSVLEVSREADFAQILKEACEKSSEDGS